ncbi:hypothetical protein [Streptomyces zhaozhouensis]|uniref:hypothetical protein n=1 Tax=Streptomyces zhaozhouensis TaxID=1300267 RepID=UPI001485782D|nr:hypothetical protein [Streptomyces zhaozhouensis]
MLPASMAESDPGRVVSDDQEGRRLSRDLGEHALPVAAQAAGAAELSQGRGRTARYGKGKPYRVGGIPGVRDRSFETLEDVRAWLRRSSVDEERGDSVDPRQGDVTLADHVTGEWTPGKGGAPRPGPERPPWIARLRRRIAL